MSRVVRRVPLARSYTQRPGRPAGRPVRRTHARLGHVPAARRELEHAQQIFADLGPEQTDAVFFGFPARELAMYTSQVLSWIGDPATWDAQTAALDAYPDDDPMDRPLIALDRA